MSTRKKFGNDDVVSLLHSSLTACRLRSRSRTWTLRPPRMLVVIRTLYGMGLDSGCAREKSNCEMTWTMLILLSSTA